MEFHQARDRRERIPVLGGAAENRSGAPVMREADHAETGRDGLVVLVSETGFETGTETKLRAHQGVGLLHLAVSIVVVDGDGRLLLQRRAADKYHFAGLWSNACCTHPGPGLEPEHVAKSRLLAEMGFETPLLQMGAFMYQAADPRSGLTEYEFDRVFAGRFVDEPAPDPSEVAEWRWIEPVELRLALELEVNHYTPWLPPLLGALAEGSRRLGWTGRTAFAPFLDIPFRRVGSSDGRPEIPE